MLPATGEEDLDVTLVARLPAVPGRRTRAGGIAISIADAVIARVDVSERWAQVVFEVPRAVLRAGHNRLHLSWPMPESVPVDPIAWTGEQLASGQDATLHPVFGEVFTLRVASARASQ